MAALNIFILTVHWDLLLNSPNRSCIPWQVMVPYECSISQHKKKTERFRLFTTRAFLIVSHSLCGWSFLLYNCDSCNVLQRMMYCGHNTYWIEYQQKIPFGSFVFFLLIKFDLIPFDFLSEFAPVLSGTKSSFNFFNFHASFQILFCGWFPN